MDIKIDVSPMIDDIDYDAKLISSYLTISRDIIANNQHLRKHIGAFFLLFSFSIISTYESYETTVVLPDLPCETAGTPVSLRMAFAVTACVRIYGELVWDRLPIHCTT